MQIAQLLNLEFTLGEGARFGFFHNPTVYAFLLARGGFSRTEPFPEKCRFLAPESSRTRYLPGASYRLGLALLPGAKPTAVDWVNALRRSGGHHGSQARGVAYGPLGPSAVLRSIQDAVSGEPLRNGHGVKFLELSNVDQVARRICEMRELTLRFDSPLFIPRTPVKKAFMDDQLFELPPFWQRVQETITYWFPQLAPASAPGEMHLRHNQMARAVSRSTEKHYLGACGSIVLELQQPLDLRWARALLLAGLIGTGRSTRMGQGRFSIVGAPLTEHWPPRPVETHCERAAEDANLELARIALQDSGPTPGVDGIERDAYVESLTYRKPVLQTRLALGDHRPSALRGLMVRKKSGGMRPLTIPTIEDRFLQRACMQVITPAIDELLEESSFAYRSGLSRRSAEYRVRRAYDDGFRFVLDADLKNFFDMVDFNLLEARLKAYLGAQDPVVGLLMAWVRAPVQFAGRTLHRTRGLPQGAVVSPMLANLYLDPFDEAVEALGHRLVRYADDFVVLCRSEEALAEARRAVEDQLERLQLSLSAEKTRHTTFDECFDFLGYMFCRATVLPASRTQRAPRTGSLPPAPPDPDDEAALLTELQASDVGGWLATLRGTLEDELAKDDGDTSARFRSPITRTQPGRRPVYVISQGTRLTGSKHGLRVYEGERPIDEVAWGTISEIVVLGGRRVGPSVLQRAMRHQIPISFYSRTGQPLGVALPHRVRMPSPMTRTHWAHQERGLHTVAVASSLVEAKIHNLRLLMRYQPGELESAREAMHELGRSALRADSIPRIRGIEGQAAHLYFNHFTAWLPPAFHFLGRSGRGATDPVNALLNLLYTMLYRLCWMATLTEGLDPHLGILHQDSQRYAALAADMQEPFRFLCDRLVLELLRRRRIRPTDFQREQKDGPRVRLTPEALRLTLEAWEKRLDQQVKAGGETRTYREHIYAQARRYGALVRGERATLDPFRLMW